MKLGGRNAQSDRTAAEAAERAERLRPILTELSANRAAAELNRRKVATPAGGQWFATQVIRLRQRLELDGQGAPHEKEKKAPVPVRTACRGAHGSALGREMRRDRESRVHTKGRGIAHSERTPVSARPINAGHLDNLIKFKSSS